MTSFAAAVAAEVDDDDDDDGEEEDEDAREESSSSRGLEGEDGKHASKRNNRSGACALMSWTIWAQDNGVR